MKNELLLGTPTIEQIADSQNGPHIVDNAAHFGGDTPHMLKTLSSQGLGLAELRARQYFAPIEAAAGYQPTDAPIGEVSS